MHEENETEEHDGYNDYLINAHRPCGTTDRASQVCRLQTGVLPQRLPPSIRQQRRLIPCSDAQAQHNLACYNLHTQLNI